MNCEYCEQPFTPPPVPGIDACIEGHICGTCLHPDFPDTLPEAVGELLTLMDGDIYYDAARYQDWSAQATIDNLFALRSHVQKLLDKEKEWLARATRALSRSGHSSIEERTT